MKNNSDKFIYLTLWVTLIITVCTISYLRNTPKVSIEITPTPSPTSTIEVANNKDMTGVWISYLSLQNLDGTQESFEENFDNLIEDCKSVGATDVFVHTRAFSDAMYESEYYPWSHLITGTQGEKPTFDPLQYMIQKTHQEGMKFHAWINPLRVSLNTIPQSLSEDNPYNIYSQENPYYFIEKDGAISINPAYKEMRSLIANGVREIVENYDVDGIHFDDYFYPEGLTTQDSESYNVYCESTENPLSIEDWRSANINAMIAQVYREIKATDTKVVFGISPQANFENNKDLGADVYSWCATKGYIDYICPQIYFSYDNEYLGFTESLDEWINLPKYDGLKMYVGLGLYKAGTDADGGTWEGRDDIIANQYKDSIEKGADGVVLYDVRSIDNQKEIENFISEKLRYN